MKKFTGKTLRWEWHEGVIELTLDHEPANEIGTAMLAELEKFVTAFEALGPETSVCIVASGHKSVFSAGGDLRELYATAAAVPAKDRSAGVRAFLERIHAVLNALDAAPFVTIAAVHGACLGGGLELALACDMIIADKMARFAFPELRLGFIPGFGGIPRLKRDLGNAFVRDLLFTGRTVNATRAQAVGLVAQLAGEGEALRIARSTAAQITKYDAATRAARRNSSSPFPTTSCVARSTSSANSSLVPPSWPPSRNSSKTPAPCRTSPSRTLKTPRAVIPSETRDLLFAHRYRDDRFEVAFGPRLAEMPGSYLAIRRM